MGNYELLKAAINEVIKANGRQEITGEVLNQVLLSMVNSLGAGYQCMGVATPSTNPGTPDQNVFYFATQAGTYTNFDAIVLQAGISVLIWDGDWASQTWFTVDSAPTNNSQNLIASGAVFNALKLDGGAYDVSAHNSGATFASLSELLNNANLNTLIPTEIRHGGMSIKFVQSSDNKYVQARCMAQSFTTDVTQWQGVDTEPTEGSHNLVESGGIVKYVDSSVSEIQKDVNILLGVDKDITETTITYPSSSYNSNLELVSGNYTAYKIDVSRYIGATLKIKEWGHDFGYYRGFILNDGTITDAEIITDSTDGTSIIQNSIEIPINAKYYCTSYYADGLGSQDIDVELNGSINNIEENVSLLDDKVESLDNNVTENTIKLNSLGGVNKDISDSAIVSPSTKYNSSLEPISGTYQGYKIDVSKYIGATLYMNEFDEDSPASYSGFILKDGTTYGVTATVRGFDNDRIPHLIPENAKYYVTQWTDLLGAQNIDVVQEGSFDSKFDEIDSVKYNNVAYNQSAIAEFLQKYKAKKVDLFGQLNIALAGDSIFGRLEGIELPYTPDTNDPEEIQYGYETGHFPPNMWAQNVAYKLLNALQFPHADVKYYNHTASEVTKTGSWTDGYPIGADSLRVALTSIVGDYITLAFTGAKFVKWIYSTYGGKKGLRGATVRASFSTDNGTSWKTPSELGLTESMESSGTSGTYILPTTDYKFGNLVWGGLNNSTNYLLKIEVVSVGTMSNTECEVWGFETWSNPRINVIVTAEGGNVAYSQFYSPQRFYSDMYGQDLVIYELPFLNDLGTAYFTPTYYKGVATSTTTPAANPVDKAFYWVKEDGTFNNFAIGLVAYAGDCIEWNASLSSWVIGSRYMDEIYSAYQEYNNKELQRLRQQAVDVLTICPHNTRNDDINRPYNYYIGMPLLRAMVKKYGLANIDLNYYHSTILGYPNIWSDGTHLNSAGVDLYTQLILSVINKDDLYVGAAYPVNDTLSLNGTSEGNVSFGFEFSKIPNVTIISNSSVVITNVRKDGFDVSGSGEFNWIAKIIE